jgi:hypothetical protein
MKTIHSSGPIHSRHPMAVVAVTVLASMSALLAQSFRVTELAFDATGQVTIKHESDTNSYYILYRGDTVTTIHQPTNMALGLPGTNVFSESARGAASGFFRPWRVPLTQPHDTDGDGIDDVYELRHPLFLKPLDPLDAARDFDGDGQNNLAEYQAHTDPITFDATTTVYVVDDPPAGSPIHFTELTDAITYLNLTLLPTQAGKVLVGTDRPQAVTGLELSPNLLIEPAPGYAGRVRITGPGSSPLLITAAGSLVLNNLKIENAAGVEFQPGPCFKLLLNDLPDTVVNIGGARTGFQGEEFAPSAKGGVGAGLNLDFTFQSTAFGNLNLNANAAIAAGSRVDILQPNALALSFTGSARVGGSWNVEGGNAESLVFGFALLEQSEFTIQNQLKLNLFGIDSVVEGNSKFMAKNVFAMMAYAKVRGTGNFFLGLASSSFDQFELTPGGGTQIFEGTHNRYGTLSAKGDPAGGGQTGRFELSESQIAVTAGALFDLQILEGWNVKLMFEGGSVNGTFQVMSAANTEVRLGDDFRLLGGLNAVFTGSADQLVNFKAVGAHFGADGAIMDFQGGEQLRCNVGIQGGTTAGDFKFLVQGMVRLYLDVKDTKFDNGGIEARKPSLVPQWIKAPAAFQGPTMLAAGAEDEEVRIENVKEGLHHVYVDGIEAPVTIRNCKFTSDNPQSGVGVGSLSKSLTVQDCNFEGASQLLVGSELGSVEGEVLIQNNVLNTKAGDNYFAIALVDVANARLIHNTVTGLSASTMGLGILNQQTSGRVTLEQLNTIHVSSMPALFVAGPAQVSATDSEFTSDSGLGINTFSSGGTPYLTLQNSRVQGSPDGVYMLGGKMLTSGTQFQGDISLLSNARLEASGGSMTGDIQIGDQCVLGLQGVALNTQYISDGNDNGGLMYDPVRQGANPDNVDSPVDFDGDGCADYPPPQRNDEGKCKRTGVSPPK